MPLEVEVSPEEAKRLHDLYIKDISLDESTGTMMYKNISIFWSRSELLYNMYKEIFSLVGGSVTSIMARVTRPHGGSFILFMLGEKGSDISREDVFQSVCDDAFATGWGMIKIIEDGERIEVVAPKGFPIGRMFMDKGERSPVAVDSYFLGYFEGVFATLDRVPYTGEETECVAKGDEECRLVFKRF